MPQVADVKTSYARQIAVNGMTSKDSPMECFGEDFEMFEQLQSPEWQLCQVDDKLHVCATDGPDELLLFWMKNNVQEDSFQTNLRRKTKRVPTNFFLTETDREYVQKNCPVDNNYVQIDGSCSGSYVNGNFAYYPVFGAEACQCFVADGSGGYMKLDQMLYDVDESQKTLVIEDPQSPCMAQMQNI